MSRAGEGPQPEQGTAVDSTAIDSAGAPSGPYDSTAYEHPTDDSGAAPSRPYDSTSYGHPADSADAGTEEAVPQPIGAPAGKPAAEVHPLTPTSAPLVNPANALTVLRIVLVPVFMVLLLWAGGDSGALRIAATAVFVVAGLTDRLDGEIARRKNLVTAFGQIADPIADKALIGAALVGLSILALLPWWVTALILARELGVTLLRLWVIRHGVIPASRGGKLKTLLQSFAIGFYLLPLSGWPATGRAWLMAVAVLVTLVTGGDYVARAITLRSTSQRALAQRARAAAQATGDVVDPRTAASERLGMNERQAAASAARQAQLQAQLRERRDRAERRERVERPATKRDPDRSEQQP